MAQSDIIMNFCPIYRCDILCRASAHKDSQQHKPQQVDYW